MLFYLAYQAVNKKRASGLPMNFVLAVTESEVVAYKYKPGGYGKITIRDEAARWQRGDIRVADRSDGPMASKVTFKTSENGESERIVCNAPMLTKNPGSMQVLELIGSG